MSKEFEIYDEDWAEKLQADYEDYMWNCESLLDLDDDAEEANTIETLSGEPYCGCSTCHTREQLFFLVPRIIKAYTSGQVNLTGENAPVLCKCD